MSLDRNVNFVFLVIYETVVCITSASRSTSCNDSLDAAPHCSRYFVICLVPHSHCKLAAGFLTDIEVERFCQL